jgi:hypothetical protein
VALKKSRAIRLLSSPPSRAFMACSRANLASHFCLLAFFSRYASGQVSRIKSCTYFLLFPCVLLHSQSRLSFISSPYKHWTETLLHSFICPPTIPNMLRQNPFCTARHHRCLFFPEIRVKLSQRHRTLDKINICVTHQECVTLVQSTCSKIAVNSKIRTQHEMFNQLNILNNSHERNSCLTVNLLCPHYRR